MDFELFNKFLGFVLSVSECNECHRDEVSRQKSVHQKNEEEKDEQIIMNGHNC